jgi:hypothetical protein
MGRTEASHPHQTLAGAGAGGAAPADDVYEMPDDGAATAALPPELVDDVYEMPDDGAATAPLSLLPVDDDLYEMPVEEGGSRRRRSSIEWPAAHRTSLGWFAQVGAEEGHSTREGDEGDGGSDSESDYAEMDPVAFAASYNAHVQQTAANPARTILPPPAPTVPPPPPPASEYAGGAGSSYENVANPTGAPTRGGGGGGRGGPTEWKESNKQFLPGMMVDRGLTQRYEQDKKVRLQKMRQQVASSQTIKLPGSHYGTNSESTEDGIDL